MGFNHADYRMNTKTATATLLISRPLLVLFIILFQGVAAIGQITLKGQIVDRSSGLTLIGASVIEQGTTNGTTTDLDGNFEVVVKSLPVVLSIDFMGYESQTYTVKSADEKLKFKLLTKNFELKAVEISETRISDRQKESALTMESMDVLAIKEAASSDFYEGLGNLKGVDVTSASIGFKIINTRGFNSTSPVRSLQIIDGVDNQAPGLNFSLGNFLGASELDVMRMDLIQGASSAYYGPNAFNGVISMDTKDPFLFPGLSVMAKVGERNLMTAGVRYAKIFTNKDSVEKFAFKVNLSYMRANDWEATNLDTVFGSEVDALNWGGYDAVNRYGDEDPIYFNSPNLQVSNPGLGIIYRTGYEERDVVDYGSENLKANVALHYKVNNLSQLILSSSFGTGTTVYQGDNRYSLRDVLFFQNRIEYKSPKGFIRAYATNEDAGNSYDAVFTALLLQDQAKDNNRWATDYGYYWANTFADRVKDLPGFPTPQIIGGQVVYDFDLANEIMNQFSDSLQLWHNLVRDLTDLGVSPPGNIIFNENQDRLEPGTEAFDQAFKDITSRNTFAEGGSRFWDRSALYHIHGEQAFELDSTDFTEMTFKVGGNFRQYRPNSRGTIFSDTIAKITNNEYGVYFGIEKPLYGEALKVSATVRIDKNQNFPFVASPAASLVYKLDEKNILRFSASSAIRNPTLQDQYLYYNVGRAILIGNIDGYDSLVTIESARDLASSQNPDTLVYFNVAPVVPEKVKTLEVGWRSTIGKRLYVDLNYYYSFYTDFLGFNIGVDAVIDQNTNLFNPSLTQVYRIAANATETVTTQGFSVGSNYYFRKFITLNGNYTWNRLNSKSDDPIIPAYNTPEHKFNVGISGREINTFFKLSKKEEAKSFGINNYGFSVNYRWVQGYQYEGSPQFTGPIPTYYTVDLQINKYVPRMKTTFKVGASNLTDNAQFQVYGGPRVGRMAYFSVLVEPDRKN